MICCVTGHRPKNFPELYNDKNLYNNFTNELYNTILSLSQNNYTHFISGMARGIDIDFAEAVIKLKKQNPSICLEAALPHPLSQANSSNKKETRSNLVLQQCDLVRAVSDHYFNGCMHKRNRYMVDKSDIVIAVWNGTQKGGTWSTIQYAISQSKPILLISIKDGNVTTTHDFKI